MRTLAALTVLTLALLTSGCAKRDPWPDWLTLPPGAKETSVPPGLPGSQGGGIIKAFNHPDDWGKVMAHLEGQLFAQGFALDKELMGDLPTIPASVGIQMSDFMRVYSKPLGGSLHHLVIALNTRMGREYDSSLRGSDFVYGAEIGTYEGFRRGVAKGAARAR